MAAPTISLAPPAISMHHDPTFFQILTTNEAEDNNSGYIQVYARYDDEYHPSTWPENFIVELEPNYGNENKATIGIHRLLKFLIDLPTTNSLTQATIASGKLGRNSGEIQLRFQDQFGSPKIIQDPLQNSPWYKVVNGATRNWNGFAGKYSASVILLNSWVSFRRSVTRNKWSKEILKNQPEYLSFYVPTLATASISFTANILLKNGTLVPGVGLGSANLVKGCNWVSTSFHSFNLHVLYPTAVKYYLEIKYGATLLGTITYHVLQNEPDNPIYILMETGTGGVEVLRVAGKKTYEHEVSSVEYEKAVWLGTSQQQGTIHKDFKQGQPRIKCNSGYFQREYIEHLTQLLYSRIWLIDMVRNKFYAYNVVTSSVKESDDNDELHNLEFTIDQGWKSNTASTFNQ